MPKKGKHITKGQREVIQGDIGAGLPARQIAVRIDRSPSTVTREVKTNRTIRVPNIARVKPSTRCTHYRECERVGKACEACGKSHTHCKDCPTHACTATCPDFELRMCEVTERWPYVCPKGCPKRKGCTLPKCSYSAADAEASHRERLVTSRQGVDLTEEQLAELDATVSRLSRQGHSFEAICAEEDVPVCPRTLYNYQEAGILSVAAINMPRKARVRKRKRKKAKKGEERTRIDRTGRTYDDFQALPLEERARVVMGDSVEGFQGNAQDILSLHLLSRKFQLYLLKGHGRASETVECLDAIECAMGSAAAFERVFGVLLVDRGTEFDDWEGMERSYLEDGARRCRVFYCDAMDSNQKSQAERNHEQLRRILPKGRTDMDRMGAEDVATCCSHVNSYPLESLGGASALDLVGGLGLEGVLELFGVRRLDPTDVVLLPSLMPHAVEQ